MSDPEGQSSPLHERNREILEAGIFGETALGAYDAAVAMDPRLTGIEVTTPEERQLRPRFARAIPSWDLPLRDTSRHRLALYNHYYGLSIALVALTRDVERVPGAAEYFGERIGSPEDEPLDPHDFYAFGLLRELGRASDFINYGHRQAEYAAIRERDSRALPIAHMSVAQMIEPGTRRSLMRRWDELAVKYEVGSYDELVAKQFLATRATIVEGYADDFAAGVLREHPELRRI